MDRTKFDQPDGAGGAVPDDLATAIPRPWPLAMREAVRDAEELCRLLQLPEAHWPSGVRSAERFPVFAPHEFIRRMKPGDPDDPLLRQVLPTAEEDAEADGFVSDPLAESAAEIVPGLLQKYEGRALLITTGACAVHCRYCFRRNYPYSQVPKSLAAWRGALDAIAADASLREVILSGGDPLTIPDARLAALAEAIAAIGHVRRLRIHTRLPIVIPQRVCDDLLAWLTGTRLRPIVVLHANHPAEIDAAVAGCVGRLLAAGVVVLNQAVLLRGVNDCPAVLTELCERLVDLGVMPYYLHQLDRVAGASHFEVPILRGQRLIDHLRARLPGYAVPRYVTETPGDASKRVLS